MGGEKCAVLVYGPDKIFDLKNLIEIFKLVDYNKYCIKCEDCEEECKICFDEEFYNIKYELHDLLDEFLDNKNISVVYYNNVSTEIMGIGILIDKYENPESDSFKEKMKNIIELCKEYNLPEPVYYAGLQLY
jgi:ferredoxin